MSEVIVKNAVVREKGFIYFIDRDGNLCRAVRGRKRKVK